MLHEEGAATELGFHPYPSIHSQRNFGAELRNTVKSIIHKPNYYSLSLHFQVLLSRWYYLCWGVNKLLSTPELLVKDVHFPKSVPSVTTFKLIRIISYKCDSKPQPKTEELVPGLLTCSIRGGRGHPSMTGSHFVPTPSYSHSLKWQLPLF